MPCGIMGSVGSLLNGHSLNSKHCQASECPLKKGSGSRQRRPGGRSLDALLKYGFSQGSSSASSQPSKAPPPSRSAHSDDFFYIKVTQKPRSAHRRAGSLEGRLEGGGASSDHMDPDGGRLAPPPTSGRAAVVSVTDQSAVVRPTAFKPVLPRSTSSPGATAGGPWSSPGATAGGPSSLDHFLGPLERARGPVDVYGHNVKQDTFSGTLSLSDSGRNSMSSLPTHSTSGSLSAAATPAPPTTHSVGSSTTPAPPHPNCPPWTNNGNVFKSISPSYNVSGGANSSNGGGGSKANSGDSGGVHGSLSTSADRPPRRVPASESAGGGIRSPITTDELLIERLEQRLLERESELHELQESLEDKEADTCLLLEERQHYRTEELEELKQRCCSQLHQASQRAARNQQALQLQLNQLQVDKERLQEDVSRMTREKDQAEVRLRSYETASTQLAPTLEETQWEVCQKSGEISLLKQQLRDCQADAGHKLSEIVGLKGSLREMKAQLEALDQQNQGQAERIHACNVDIEVCQNELQRKKNEADLLRGKVGELEADIRAMKQDLADHAKEQRHRHSLKLEAQAQAQAQAQSQASSGRQQSQQGDNVDALHTKGEQQQQQEKEDQQAPPPLLLRQEVERLKEQLQEEREAQERLASGFQQERQTWSGEKERVLRYQRQLQLNYLHVHRKNRDLERILKEVTAELESRAAGELPDKDSMAYSSGLQTYEDVIATEI